HTASADETVDASAVSWAVTVLVDSALHPYMGNPIPQAMFPNGADRQAALALPRALHLATAGTTTEDPADQRDGRHTDQLGSALRAGTTSLFDEVRYTAAEGLRYLWPQPCRTAEDGRCHHQIAWQAVEAGARDVVLGPYGE